MNDTYYSAGGCHDLIQSCYSTSDNNTCSTAQDACNGEIFTALGGPWDVYFVPADDTDPYPPDLIPYLNNNALAERIGAFAGASQDVAAAGWVPLGGQVYVNFANSGDWMRNSRPDLEKVIDAGVRTIVYDGDVVRARLVTVLASGLLNKFGRTTS